MIKFAADKDETVGLDIGKHSIKVVAIEKEGGEKTITAYNIKKIPFDTNSEQLEQLVKETFEEIDLKVEYVNMSVAGPDVIARFINLPKMNREQLENALVFEAEKYIPFNISEVVLDFLILGDALEPGQMRVLLAAAKKEPIEEKVRMLEKLGIKIHVVDTDPFATFNAFTEITPPDEDSGTAFLDIGHVQTNVLISIGKTPCFMRQIQIGGKDVEDELCRGLSITPEKAEEYVLGIGEGDKESVIQASRRVLDNLTREVHLSFGYFENRYNKSINTVYGCGGMIFQEGVIDYLGEKLGIKVERWNPVRGLKISENLSREDVESVAPRLAVSIGLALRA